MFDLIGRGFGTAAIAEQLSVSIQTRPEPRTRSLSSDTSKPRNGDVIVSVVAAPQAGFGLRQLPGAVHLTMSRREVAAEVARRFAERYGVDVWFDGGTYTLLASFRRAVGGKPHGTRSIDFLSTRIHGRFHQGERTHVFTGTDVPS